MDVDRAEELILDARLHLAARKWRYEHNILRDNGAHDIDVEIAQLASVCTFGTSFLIENMPEGLPPRPYRRNYESNEDQCRSLEFQEPPGNRLRSPEDEESDAERRRSTGDEEEERNADRRRSSEDEEYHENRRRSPEANENSSNADKACASTSGQMNRSNVSEQDLKRRRSIEIPNSPDSFSTSTSDQSDESQAVSENSHISLFVLPQPSENSSVHI